MVKLRRLNYKLWGFNNLIRKSSVTILAVLLLVLLYPSQMFAAQKNQIQGYEQGHITINYLGPKGDIRSEKLNTLVVRSNNQMMVPLVKAIFYKPDSSLKTDALYKGETAAILVTNQWDDNKLYEFSLGMKTGTIKDKSNKKIGTVNLSVEPFNVTTFDITSPLTNIEGATDAMEVPFVPLDFFDKIGYSAKYSGSGGNIEVNLIPPGYEKTVEQNKESKLYPVSFGNKYGYMNAQGKVVIKPQFYVAHEFSEGLAPVQIKDKMGYINQEGKIVIEPQFNIAFGFSDGLAPVDLGDHMGYINKSGKVVIEPELPIEYATSFTSGVAVVTFHMDQSHSLIDKRGIIVVPPILDDIGFFSEGIARAEENGSYGFIDSSGEWIIEPQYQDALDFSEALAAVKINGKWGFIDRSANKVIDAKYDEVYNFSEGLAQIKLNGKIGFIDKTGKTIIQPQFDEGYTFKEGLASVKKDGKWGYIDKTGTIVIKPAHEWAEPFDGNIAVVQNAGVRTYIDKKGNPFLPLNDKGQPYTSVYVAGNVIEVNGKVVDLPAEPIMVNGKTLAPVRAIMQSLGMELKWDSATNTITGVKGQTTVIMKVGSKEAKVNGKVEMLDAPPQIVGDNTFVPVSFLANSIGANEENVAYPTSIPSGLTIKSLLGNDYAVYDKYMAASERLKKAQQKFPAFEITGSIDQRDPFYVFGATYSETADPSHEAFVPNFNNLKIENPNKDHIVRDSYIGGIHYYKGKTKEKGLYKPLVDVYIFGAAPKELAGVINEEAAAKAKLITANEVNIAKVASKYEGIIQQSPNDPASYLNYATALVDLSEILDDAGYLQQAQTQVDKATTLSAKSKDIYDLIIADRYSNEQQQIETYKRIAQIDPYLILSYAATNNRYGIAAKAFEQVEYLVDYAKYCASKANQQ